MRSPERLSYAIQALAPYWGDLAAGSVIGSTCRRYVRVRGVASATARRELGVLQAAINYAFGEGILTIPVKVTLPEGGKPKERWMTRSEVAHLLWHSPPHLRRFIILSLYTGRRMRSVLGLRWTPSPDSGWIDLDAGIIHFLGQQETESSKRKGSIRMPLRLEAHLRRWHDPEASHTIMYRGEPLDDVGSAWDRASKRAGISDVTPHTLKHTAVTLAFQGGMTIEQATDYFATTAATLERVYRQHSPHHQSQAVEIMQRLGR